VEATSESQSVLCNKNISSPNLQVGAIAVANVNEMQINFNSE